MAGGQGWGLILPVVLLAGTAATSAGCHMLRVLHTSQLCQQDYGQHMPLHSGAQVQVGHFAAAVC